MACTSSTGGNIMTPLLTLSHVSKRFGGLTAVDDVSISIHQGEIYGLIGPNGAGKTTCFNLITGLYRADSGEFRLQDRRYKPQAIDKVAQAGIARTFQNLRLFNEMSVLENVMVGCHLRTRNGLWAAISRHRRARQEEQATREKSYALLEYVGISQFADYRAGDLSYGHQRRLEIARALATEPKLLALDEPAAGMNAAEKVALRELLQRIRESGKTLLLIEHDVKLVMGLCDRLTVLDYGKVIAEGEPAQVRREPAVIRAYLGGAAHV
jgi:branched-chain amino acid transport system ATP-binding protein